MRGLYTVQTEEGLIISKARGLFRLEGREIDPIVGDNVRIRLAPDGDIGYIEEVFKRKNSLIRPPVANIDRVLIVMSIVEPDINLMLLDRFLLMCEKENLKAILVFSKADLDDDTKRKEISNIYKRIGYKVYFTSINDKKSFYSIEKILKYGTTALAGPSGTGKSSILQAIYPDLKLEIGKVSERTRRGRHTTRHIEIYKLGEGSYVLDTPGFSSLEFDMEKENISDYFKEFPKGECRFDNCLHDKEPGCAVKVAVKEKIIADSRYENYLVFLKEARNQRRY